MYHKKRGKRWELQKKEEETWRMELEVRIPEE